ncbi:AAA family ATPase [Pelagibacterium montanilacus]|uniref:AAA family ATPase n=1 Tax=Pelagibacterium montanilacus TaxID=2185280 RepID=UPI0019D300C2|nr:ATP-binding protein [Pelagibacterium montanilacus]
MANEKMGDSVETHADLAQAIKLGLRSGADDIRLFAAKLVRKYRQHSPDLAKQIDEYLRSTPASSPLRRKPSPAETMQDASPDGPEAGLALLRIDTQGASKPVLSSDLDASIQQLLTERRQAAKLQRLGLEPIRSAIFVGPPGVGKTMSARWIAAELGLPLYVLDLTAIMSSFLGKTGTNLRAVLDYAKKVPCVLLLDEVDAIAKRRGDLSDVGELKRLVTVILQEIDAWPSTGLLLAATNHPELIDPALWRRFDLTLEFPKPSKGEIAGIVQRSLSDDATKFEPWREILSSLFLGTSFSDIDRTLRQFRKAVSLKTATPSQLVEDYVRRQTINLDKAGCLDLARQLAISTDLSHHKIHDITGVSRDTIRKYKREDEAGNGN